MHDIVFVGKSKRVCTRKNDGERVPLRQASGLYARQVTAQRLAVEQLHRHEPGVPFAIDIEYSNDVGVWQRLCLLKFALEALDLLGFTAQWLAQHFQGDQRVASHVAGAKYDAAATLADLLFQDVAIANGRTGYELDLRRGCRCSC